MTFAAAQPACSQTRSRNRSWGLALAVLSGTNAGAYIYNCPGGAGTRVAIAVGDYYIVATAGGQFYCSGDVLDVGDSIVASQDAAADTSTANDWGILEGDNIEGTGLANTAPRWTDTQVLGNSNITQNPISGNISVSTPTEINSTLFVLNDLELSSDFIVGGGTILMGNGAIEELIDPTNPQDAATKAYVDAGNVGQVTGTGTTQTLPIWSDGPAGVLGDSIVTYDQGTPLLQVNLPVVGYSFGNASFKTNGGLGGFDF